ncbi:MAG: hypothetical protein HDT41_00465 [Lachnospiraceae bacterium]|nr:hypothetical protein [Lachnospiraceae bacterium]
MFPLAAAVTMSDALTDIGSLVTTAIGIITANNILMVCFCGGLLGIGFTIVRQAKRAAMH